MSEFQDATDCYERIAQLLGGAVPEAWDSLRVEVELDGTSVQMISEYSPAGTAGEIREIDYVPGLGKCFYDLARLVSTPEKGLYKKCVFTLTSEGQYATSFEY